jgi:hypothetical protein
MESSLDVALSVANGFPGLESISKPGFVIGTDMTIVPFEWCQTHSGSNITQAYM